jgi:hypothetical protein
VSSMRYTCMQLQMEARRGDKDAVSSKTGGDYPGG